MRFASNDRYVHAEKARAFVAAVAGEKVVRTYDAGHDLTAAAAIEDRRIRLAAHLKLPSPPP